MATPRDGETELEMLQRQAAHLTGLTGQTYLVIEGPWVVPATVFDTWPDPRPVILWPRAK